MNNGRQIADTIAQQLGGYGPMKAMLGVTGFVYAGPNESQEGSLTVIFKAKGCLVNNKQPNRFTVSLSLDDIYTVTFGRLHGLKYTGLQTTEGVYCDQLQTLVEGTLGLRTSLHRVTFA